MDEAVRDAQIFRAIVETAPDAMLVMDADATIVLVNAQAETIFGYPRDELVGRSVELLVPERFRGEHAAQLGLFAADPAAAPTAREVPAVRRDGREFPVEVSLAVLPTASNGTPRSILVSAVVRDVSERRALLEESHRLREELFATVSHELRTPLTSIIGYAELLADLPDEDLSATARKLVSVIARNADRELRLVNDLLTRTWLDDDPATLVRAPVDLGEVARTVVADARVRSASDDVVLTFEEQEAASVLGDRDRLTQVVENLVSNALKFTPPGGRVEVRVCANGGMAILEVADTGIGVSQRDRERLFERLYRAPEAVDHHIQGAGLGLSIVKAIVTAHQGWIDVESAPGRGSTFRVVLPAHQAQKSRLSTSSMPRSAS